MLNKDQYNQDEYNDYYRKEVEGAELRGGEKSETKRESKNGLIKKIILLLTIIALAIAGYFGYKAFGTSTGEESNSAPTTETQKSESELVKIEEQQNASNSSTKNTPKEDDESSQEKSDKNSELNKNQLNEVASLNEISQEQNDPKVKEITDKVEKVMSNNSKMSPEEIASIVSAVMKQIKHENNATQKSQISDNQESELLTTLTDSDVDSVTNDLEEALNDVDINQDTQIENEKKQIDVYNKVNLQETSGDDTLSQLSNEINSIINEEENSISINNEKTYTEGLKKEVVSRKKEMRIIVVKKGDTLGKLAKRAYGNVMEYKRIYRANPNITRADRIYVGQKIRIPLD